MAKKKKRRRSSPASTPKRRSGGGGRKRRSGGRRRGGRAGLTSGWDKTDLAIALVTAGAMGYLQAKVAKTDDKPDEFKWYKEMPVVTPLGRVGTAALVAGGVAHFGKVRRAKGVALGLGIASVFSLGRREFSMYTEEEIKTNLAGYDEATLGGLADYLALGGEVDVEYDDDNG